MSKQPSLETQLKNARREINDLRKKLSTEAQNVSFYRQRASKAEAEASEWRRRFDQLLAREPIPTVTQVNTMKCPRCDQPWISIPRMGIHHVCPDGKTPTPEDFAGRSAEGKSEPQK